VTKKTRLYRSLETLRHPGIRFSANCLSVVAENLFQSFSGLLCGAARFRDLPLHFAGADFILRDAAGFAGIGLHYRRRSRLQLASAPGGDQNVAIVAVEAFDQFHGILSLVAGTQDFDCRKFYAAFFASEAE
jgi:hypothetical protein